MANPSQKETDEILKKLEKRLKKEYEQANQEVSEKLADYFKRFETKDKIKRDQLVRGVITRQEYNTWRTNQMLMGERWKAMKEQISNDLAHVDQIAKGIINNAMPEIYALNHNYATYQIEKMAGIDTSYTLYNRNAVARVLRENPQLLPPPGKQMKKKLAEGVEKAWNMERVQSVLLQGIIQGESIPQLSRRLYRVTEGNYKAAIRNARTMTTGAENAGHADAYQRARDRGVQVVEFWSARLDERTRISHRLMDGEKRQDNGYFVNGLRYPGDPNGDPSEVYNCRCRLDAQVEGFERDYSDVSRRSERINGITYDEWKYGHEAKYAPIDLQEQIAEGMRWRTINEDYKK